MEKKFLLVLTFGVMATLFILMYGESLPHFFLSLVAMTAVVSSYIFRNSTADLSEEEYLSGNDLLELLGYEDGNDDDIVVKGFCKED